MGIERWQTGQSQDHQLYFLLASMEVKMKGRDILGQGCFFLSLLQVKGGYVFTN
jgi:hypothetical protein